MNAGCKWSIRPTRRCLTLLSLLFISPVMANWTPELAAPADSGFRQPAEAIRLFIPPDVPLETLQRLTLELDDIDVTAMVGREGDYASFVPVQPLGFGQHRLRLLENSADGSIIERGFWRLEIRKSAAFREATLNMATSAELSQRLAENNLSDLPPQRTQGTGSAIIQGRAADNDWQAGVNLPLFYSSNSEGREVDVGEFLMDWQQNALSAKVGHHPISPDNLVMSGFNRRGVSASYSAQAFDTRVTGFSMRGSQLAGFQGGLGVTDNTDQVNGGVVTAYPINRTDASMAVSAIYLSGEAPDTGQGVAGSSLATGGDAWSIMADNLWLEKRLRLRGEYARTDYDFDGSGGYESEKDDAYSLLLTYKPWMDKQVNDQYLDWNLGTEYRQVGTYFKSVASPGSTADRKTARLFSDLTWGGFNLQGQLSQETDNVVDLPTLPRLRTRLATLSTTYTPMPDYTPEGELVTGWMGYPSYSLFGNLQSAKTTARSSADPNTWVDTQTRILGASANFSHDNWSWGINHTWTRLYDDSGEGGTPTTNESRSRSTGLDFFFTLTPNYTLTPHVAWDETAYLDLGYTDKSLLWGVGLDARLIPDQLTGRLEYSLNRAWVTNDSSDNTTDQVSASLTWNAVKSSPTRPGVSLTLSGDYHEYSDAIVTGNYKDSYQLFLRALIGWAGTY
ncbi:hypothetical protein [Sedimenticola selenatireducens]|nr:hypothetical protein [Sedimenticola selenatireducens]